MNQALTIAKKELRAYFLSPVALIFLATFLFLTLFAFFWVDTFFRRNIADIRPLFHWLPILLIFLVSALTMRLWSEEQRTGTLEILLTLPVKTHQLVLGKFLAGLGLVAVALVLTLGLPITVSMLGDLDWGPVVGGYLGALLLAAAYLAMGLCVSALTDNPIVALIASAALCGGFYLVGSEAVVSLAGNRMAELLGGIGTGSRFASIQRGVIDLRDLVYYGSLTAGFLFLNVVILEAKRWSEGISTRLRRNAAKLAVVLVAANLILLNVGVTGIRGARLDLTERKEYSVSPVTKSLLRSLDAPLILRGYFSAKTHPLLAPLVPRIRDMLDEYATVGGDHVTSEFIDPQQDPAAEKEANEDYAIKSVPFQFADRHEAAVVNSYFHILIKYGNKHETLSFQDLIELNVSGMRDIEVKLRNLEYDLTRSIKKVAYGFKPLEELFASVTSEVKLTAYVSPRSLPENFKLAPERLEKVGKELQLRSNGKVVFTAVDPTAGDSKALRQELYQKYGLRPMMASLFGGEMFYLGAVVQSGDKHALIRPTPEMTETELKTEITAALRRMAPGFLKTVGLITPPAQMARPDPRMPGMPPQQTGPRYQLLRTKLAENYTVKEVNLKGGRVPGDVDVLFVLGVRDFDEKERFAIDQFLMRGGSVIVGAGHYAMELSRMGGGGLNVAKKEGNLTDLLDAWGIRVSNDLVLDPQNEAFPVPVERNLMGLKVREIRMIDYPFWVDVRPPGMSDESPVVAGLPAVTVQWVSPLQVTSADGVEYTSLLESTDQAWTQSGTDVQPNFAEHPEKGFGPGEEAEIKARVLAVAGKGKFRSAFRGKRSPLLNEEEDAQARAEAIKKATAAGEIAPSAGVIETSVEDARLIVIGSSEFIRDEVLTLSRQTGSNRFTNNIRLAENFLDWSVADVDLLSIRSRGTYARTLLPSDEATRTRWEWINYGIVILALIGIVLATITRRRKLHPMELQSATQEG